MIVSRITKVYLNPSLRNDLSINYVNRTEAWLGQWTCLNNFECVIKSSREECIESMKKQLMKTFSFHPDFNCSDFVFNAAFEEVQNDSFFLPDFEDYEKFSV